MPQPHGTYLKTSNKAKVIHRAQQDRKKTSPTATDEPHRAAFYKALDKHSESELGKWKEFIDALTEKLRNKQRDNLTDEDQSRAAKIVKDVQVLLEFAIKRKEFVDALGSAGKTVIAASFPKGWAGWDLALCLAIVKVLEVMVRLRKK